MSTFATFRTITDSTGRVMNNVIGNDGDNVALEKLQQEVANWLTTNNKAGVSQVLSYGSKAEKSALVAIFDEYNATNTGVGGDKGLWSVVS